LNHCRIAKSKSLIRGYAPLIASDDNALNDRARGSPRGLCHVENTPILDWSLLTHFAHRGPNCRSAAVNGFGIIALSQH
jgi:hypothetical protein